MLSYIQIIFIYAFILGSIYLLMSLGFSIICGVLRIFHLGYAYFFTVTVYGTWLFLQEFGMDLIPAIICMVLLQFVIAFLIYKFVIKKYLEEEMVLLTALILITIIIQQVFNY